MREIATTGRARRLALALLLLLAGTGMTAQAASAKYPNRPPKPVLVAPDGSKQKAARGSFCWTSRSTGYCADTMDPLGFAPAFAVPADRNLKLRMRLRTRSVIAQDRDGNPLRLRPIGKRKRNFLLTPRWDGADRLGVYIFSTYRKGKGRRAMGGDLLSAIWLTKR